MKTILITGINGYLGSHLAKALSVEYNIIGLEYTLENLHRIQNCNYKVYEAQKGIPDALFSDQRVDIIIHTATFYGRSNEDVQTIANANLFNPLELLDQAIKNNCSLFINTDTVVDRYVSTYALTKRHFQEWLYLRRNEIKVINMQLEHFYGPGSSATNFISAMIERLKKNEDNIDLTMGEQKRDFVFIDDIVAAYQTGIKQISYIRDNYTDFIVSANQLITIKDLMIYLKEITKSSSILNFGALPYRKNELMHSETNNQAMLNLGWKPKTTLKEGLQLTCNAH